MAGSFLMTSLWAPRPLAREKPCLHFKQLEERQLSLKAKENSSSSQITNVYADFESPLQRNKNHIYSIIGEYAECLNEAPTWMGQREYLGWRGKDHLGSCLGFDKCQVSLLELASAVRVRLFSWANFFNLIKIMWLHPSITLAYINWDAAEESCSPCSCFISHQAERL